jgi:hypothetical protein
MGFFNSPVQDAIEEATSEKLQDVDWGRILNVCDMINSDPEAYVAITLSWQHLTVRSPKDAIKTIGKRLQHSSWKVNQHALTVCALGESVCKTEACFRFLMLV